MDQLLANESVKFLSLSHILLPFPVLGLGTSQKKLIAWNAMEQGAGGVKQVVLVQKLVNLFFGVPLVNQHPKSMFRRSGIVAHLQEISSDIGNKTCR